MSAFLVCKLEQLSPVSFVESLESDVASMQHPALHLQGSCLSHSSWNCPGMGDKAITTQGASAHHGRHEPKSVDFLYLCFFSSKNKYGKRLYVTASQG